MSDLSTDIVQLGSYDTGRDVRRSEEFGSVYWHIQSAAGCCGRDHADACALGIADGHEQEIHLEWNVWIGYNV